MSAGARVSCSRPPTAAASARGCSSNAQARFELARRLARGHGPPLGEVFAFLSGLYFRGKLAYARAFARPPGGVPGVW